MDTLTWMGVGSFIFVVGFTINAARNATGAGQSPRGSIIEAWTNIVIGFSINYTANLVIIPMAIHGGHLDPWANFWMGWVYTVISILRQYAIRRWFNARTLWQMKEKTSHCSRA